MLQYIKFRNFCFIETILYKFIIDGTEFQGSYTLSSQSDAYSTEDGNPKYNVEITDFSETDGIVTVLIKEKVFDNN